jgi:hypothetical protein
MVWVYPEYGGQVAVRIGEFKILRRGLMTKRPGGWEVYDLSKDRGEAHNLAATRSDLVRRAIDILKAETLDNPLFPIRLPDES